MHTQKQKRLAIIRDLEEGHSVETICHIRGVTTEAVDSIRLQFLIGAVGEEWQVRRYLKARQELRDEGHAEHLIDAHFPI